MKSMLQRATDIRKKEQLRNKSYDNLVNSFNVWEIENNNAPCVPIKSRHISFKVSQLGWVVSYIKNKTFRIWNTLFNYLLYFPFIYLILFDPT